eukprot:11928623-Ditylum_brightwellii.AAC.1
MSQVTSTSANIFPLAWEETPSTVHSLEGSTAASTLSGTPDDLIIFRPESNEYIKDIKEKTAATEFAIQEQCKEPAKQQTETKTILDTLAAPMNTVSQQYVEMEEWRQNLDEELQLKFEEQNIIISEVLEEQNAKMDANVQDMLEIYKEEYKTS